MVKYTAFGRGALDFLKDPPGAETDIWEPDYGDPVFLKKLVESVEAYHATWLSLHGWPKEIYDNSKDAYARAAQRIGYRFELREVDYPETVKLGQPVTVKSTWVNVGVARRYKGGQNRRYPVGKIVITE